MTTYSLYGLMYCINTLDPHPLNSNTMYVPNMHYLKYVCVIIGMFRYSIYNVYILLLFGFSQSLTNS